MAFDISSWGAATAVKDSIAKIIENFRALKDDGIVTPKALDASAVTTGVFDIARIPAAAIERLVQVANQAARFALTTGVVQLGDTVKQLDTGIMYVVVDVANLSNEAGYVQYTAGSAASVPWSGVTGKPSTLAGYGVSVNANEIVNTPAGNISSTKVQDAINELDAEKVNKYQSVNGLDMNTVIESGFYAGYTMTNSAASEISTFMVARYSQDWIYQEQHVINQQKKYYRFKYNGTTWSPWVLANAKLATARNINGVPFDGSIDIVVPTIYDAGYKSIINPGGANYTSSGSVTGAIAVILPVNMTNNLVKMRIEVYEHSSKQSFSIHCGGFTFAGTNSWVNPFAYIIGSPVADRRFTVRFGYTATGKCVVYIGELNSVWSYPQIFVTDVQIGGSGGFSSTWTAGWSIGIQTTDFENITGTVTDCQVGYAASTNTVGSVVKRDSSGNFAAGTITANLNGQVNGIQFRNNAGALQASLDNGVTWKNVTLT